MFLANLLHLVGIDRGEAVGRDAIHRLKWSDIASSHGVERDEHRRARAGAPLANALAPRVEGRERSDPVGAVEPRVRVVARAHHAELRARRVAAEKPRGLVSAAGEVDPHARAAQPREASGGTDEVQTIRREGPKVGRNDPCPCGSGKKHKKCCLGNP
jgi:hypothetical protein